MHGGVDLVRVPGVDGDRSGREDDLDVGAAVAGQPPREVRVGLRARWDAATGEVEQFEGQAVEGASAEAEEGSGDEGEEQMSE